MTETVDVITDDELDALIKRAAHWWWGSPILLRVTQALRRERDRANHNGSAYMVAADACNENLEEGIRLRDENVKLRAERDALIVQLDAARSIAFRTGD